jgi:hypothetical protein
MVLASERSIMCAVLRGLHQASALLLASSNRVHCFFRLTDHPRRAIFSPAHPLADITLPTFRLLRNRFPETYH